MTELLQVQFQLVEEGADPKGLPAGTLRRADNCQMDKARRLRKRDGVDSVTKEHYQPEPYSPTIDAGLRLQSRGRDMQVVGTPPSTGYVQGTYAFNYQPHAPGWRPIGRVPPLRISGKRNLVDTTRAAGAADVALAGDVLVTAFLSGYDLSNASLLHVQLENVVTGAKMFSGFVASGASFPRVHVVRGRGPGGGDTIYLTYGCTDGGYYMWVYTLGFGFHGIYDLSNSLDGETSGTSGMPSDSVTMIPSSGAHANTPMMFIAYKLETASGGFNLRYRAYTLDATTNTWTMATQALASASGPMAVGLAASPSLGVALIYSHAGSSTFVVKFDNAGAVISSTDVSATGGFSVNVWVIFHHHEGTDFLVYGRVIANAASSAHQRLVTERRDWSTMTLDSDSKRTTYHVQGTSKPWRTERGQIFCAVTLFPRELTILSSAPLVNASSVIVEVDPQGSQISFFPQPIDSGQGSPHLRVGNLENQTGWIPTNTRWCQGVAVHEDGQVYVPACYRNREPAHMQTIPIGWNLYRVDEGGGDMHRALPLGDGALAVSGAPYWSDGLSVEPYGFAHAPMIVSATGSTSGGLMGAGTYQYVARYEWRDACGRLHSSPFSPPKSASVASGSTGSVALSVATSSLDHKQQVGLGPALAVNPVSIALYRTTVGGSVFYRLTLEPQFSVIVNDPTTGAVSHTDTKGDSDVGDSSVSAAPPRPLNAQPQPPTATGELDDVLPPAALTGHVHSGRAVVVGPDGRTAWFTKDASEDPTVAPGFNEALTLAFTSEKLAVAALDEKHVFFGEDDVDVAYGKGPDATGAGAWDVQRVQTDVGCANAKSVVPTPMGVVFESRRGFELLSRDLTVSWIGKQVEDTLAEFPVVTSGVLVAAKHEVRFTCCKADGSSGVVLAWDYVHKFWFRRTYSDFADTEAASVAFVDAALIDGTYWVMTASGQIYRETSEHMLDGTAWVTRDVQTAPMSPAGPLAWHRVKDVTVLGTGVTDHRLEVSVARDHATSWEQVETFAEGTLPTMVGPLTKCRVTLEHQKCQAVQVRLRDLPPADPGDYGTGEGPILEGLAFRVGVKRGPAKTAPAEEA